MILLFYVNSKDNEKEPKLFLTLLFFMGIISCFFVIFISYFLDKIFPILSLDIGDLDYISLFVKVFFGIALIEEFCKWCFVALLGYRSKYFDETYDIIIYAVFVSLGFACFENILYVMQDGYTSAIIRALISVPGHMCFAISMGYYLFSMGIFLLS